jgi:hypothetical protein
MSQLLQIEVKSNTNKISIRFGVFGSFCHHLVYFRKTNLFSYLDKNILVLQIKTFFKTSFDQKAGAPPFPHKKDFSPTRE